jgi:multidrug resistance efflux pump
MKRTIIIVVILIIAILGGSGITYYYNQESKLYVKTDDAQITADTITISPLISGKIKEWDVKEGDEVKKGQLLGKQDSDIAIKSALAQLSQTSNSQSIKAIKETINDNALIKSPINGKIIQISAVKNQLAGQTSNLAVVEDDKSILVTANIKETDIKSIKLKQKVDITIDAYSDKSFKGAVASIGQATKSIFSLLPSQNASGNYTKVTQIIPVKITINDTKNLNLMAGMNVSVKIHIK